MQAGQAPRTRTVDDWELIAYGSEENVVVVGGCSTSLENVPYESVPEQRITNVSNEKNCLYQDCSYLFRMSDWISLENSRLTELFCSFFLLLKGIFQCRVNIERYHVDYF